MKFLKFLLLTLIGLSMIGCTATRQGASTDSASMEWRLKSLEENFLHFREKQRQMSDEDAQNREKIDQRLAALEMEMAALKGDAPASEPAPGAEPPMDDTWVTDLTPEDDAWVEGQQPPEKKADQSGEEKPWATVPKPPATIPSPEVVDRTPKAAPKAAPKPVVASAGPQDLYAKGYGQYNSGEFEAARATFDRFLKQYPKDKLAANALYWKGETYYSQKNFPQAILTFKEVTGQFPKHDKSASALLKIGMSYDKVGDRDNAVFYIRALEEDFPKSDAARIGRKELKRLGG
ncbi:tol-pal system protein YbgF [Pseudodesulfovibrio sediminis]|uniref:Cell division coordinator CpoB n=1 Tax=Pseudodesulfovibrio sediminis TaxID=2810563 RepID=A0ABN6ELM9_9BACT|nr:tol-pal system protein YbgF [Pseudodesulfovibrio sediminis]BCS86922.1 hypothetical protein PSDVSF_01640 [Pseudodesulfovibrio sediminis]